MLRPLCAALVTVALAAPSRAAFILTLTEQGGNVVASGSGTLNYTGLSSYFSGLNEDVGMNSGLGFIATGSPVDSYTGISGPTSFGSGNFTLFSSTTGGAVGLSGLNHLLYVPVNYVSGTDLSTSGVFTGMTFASLGLTPDTYTWTWTNPVPLAPVGSSAPNPAGLPDSFTLQIGSATPVTATPAPPTLALAALGAASFGGLGRLRRRLA